MFNNGRVYKSEEERVQSKEKKGKKKNQVVSARREKKKSILYEICMDKGAYNKMEKKQF